MSVIKAGYRITVDSWENDADNQRTLSVDGIQNKEYVLFLVECLQLLGSKRTYDDVKFGNMYDPSDDEWEEYINALTEVCDKHDAGRFFSGSEYVQGFKPYQYVTDKIYELHGGSEDFATRITEYIMVEYIPQDIVIEDVTSQFIGNNNT